MGRKKRRQQQPRRMVRLQLESVEFSAGHDGPWRGRPEPVFLFAIFGVNAEGITMLARERWTTHVRPPYPSVTKIPDSDTPPVLEAALPSLYTRALVLGLALEKDGGWDIAKLYQATATPEVFRAYFINEPVPDPLSLHELALGALSTPPRALNVHLLKDSAPLGKLCSSDDWVSAAALVLKLPRGAVLWRFPFASEDKRNDWTAIVRVFR